MKKMLVSSIFILVFLMCFSSKSFAHELFIQLTEEDSEVRVDVIWGHLRDFVDQGNHENYELFVREPDGTVTQLPLEKIGVQARSYITPVDEGDHVIWATRKPSTYSPSDDLTLLSMQMAKTVFHHGSGEETTTVPVELLLEIVPEASVKNFSTGILNAVVLLEGSPVENATVSAYGPAGEVLEATTDNTGAFEFALDTTGEWLLKANVRTDDGGELDGEEYTQTSMTTTFLMNTTSDSGEGTNASTLISMIVLFVVGLLLGASVSFVLVRKK